MSKAAYDCFDFKYVKTEDTATEAGGCVSIISPPPASQPPHCLGSPQLSAKGLSKQSTYHQLNTGYH